MSSKANTIALVTVFLMVATQYMFFVILEDQDRKMRGLDARLEGLESQRTQPTPSTEAQKSDA